MDKHELNPVEGGCEAEQMTRHHLKSHEKMLLLWAVSASLAAILFLGVLLFQQQLPPKVAKPESKPDEVLNSSPSSMAEDAFDSAPEEFTANLEPPPLPPLPDIFISDLKPVVFVSGWGQSHINQSVSGRPLRVGGKTYEHGLGTHANGQAVFDIPANARRFVAVVGLDDEVLNDEWGRGSVSFNVFGVVDDPGEAPFLLADSPILSPKTVRAWAFDLELESRFTRIQLIVADARDGSECDHADWVNAGFLKTASVQSFAGASRQDEPQVVRDIRDKLPAGWNCTLHRGDAVKSVPHGLEKPLFELIACNTNVAFVGFPDAPPGSERQNPVIPLYFYRQGEKSDILMIIEREKNYSWSIPIYFGETEEFVVVTSPAFVNGGVFTREARRGLRPMWKVLREFVPNKEHSAVDELAADKD